MPSPLTNHFQNVVTSQPWEVYSNGHFKSFVPPHPPRRTQELYISKTVSKTTMLLKGTINIWNSTFGERLLTLKQNLYRNSVFRYSAVLRESSCLEWNNFASRKYVTSGVLYKMMFHFLSKILHSERSLWLLTIVVSESWSGGSREPFLAIQLCVKREVFNLLCMHWHLLYNIPAL